MRLSEPFSMGFLTYRILEAKFIFFRQEIVGFFSGKTQPMGKKENKKPYRYYSSFGKIRGEKYLHARQ